MRHLNGKLGWQGFILFSVGFFSRNMPSSAPHNLDQKRPHTALANIPTGTKLILKLAAPSMLHKLE